LLTVTVGNTNVGVTVRVGDNLIVGVKVTAGVNVFVGVKVAAGVSVSVSAGAVMIGAVGVACSSLEGAQAETNRKISKMILYIFI
jgi:hypothetical protein